MRGWRRFGTLLSSGAFQFVVSAFVLGLGGTWFTAYQQCRKDAEETGIRYMRLGYEINFRRSEYAVAMGLSANVAELQARLATVSYTYAEFKDRTVRDIQGEWSRLGRKVDDAEFQRQRFESTSEITMKGRYLGQFGPLWNGQVPPVLKDEDMPDVHDFAERLHKTSQSNLGVLSRYTYRTNCGATTLLRTLFGDEEAKTVVIRFAYPRAL
jgi:hypothetical protein